MFLMYLKHFRREAEIADAHQLGSLKGKIRRALGLQRKQELEFEFESTESANRLPAVFQLVLDQDYDEKMEKRCREELQVALPLEVILECRYSASKMVAQRILEADLLKADQADIMPGVSSVPTVGNEVNHIIGAQPLKDQALPVGEITADTFDHAVMQRKSMQVNLSVSNFLWVVLEADEQHQSDMTDVVLHAVTNDQLTKGSSSRSTSPMLRWLDMGRSAARRITVTSSNRSKQRRQSFSAARAAAFNAMNFLTHDKSSHTLATHHQVTRRIEAPCAEETLRLFTRLRISNIKVGVCRSAPEDVRKSLVPRVHDESNRVELVLESVSDTTSSHGARPQSAQPLFAPYCVSCQAAMAMMRTMNRPKMWPTPCR
jgi:hypothetical protein